MSDRFLKFPCDCVSGKAGCEDSWVKVAKDGMFKDGTKELIINRLHHNPLTIAQFAKDSDLAQPTVFRHMSDLSKSGLIRESTVIQKGYTAEKYYELNFPVVTAADQERFDNEINGLASELADSIRATLDVLRKDYQQTEAARKGWRFEEIAQYVIQTAQRKARKQLEEKGQVATNLKSRGLDFIFWAEEQ